jgi:hypothetical protein
MLRLGGDLLRRGEALRARREHKLIRAAGRRAAFHTLSLGASFALANRSMIPPELCFLRLQGRPRRPRQTAQTCKRKQAHKPTQSRQNRQDKAEKECLWLR